MPTFEATGLDSYIKQLSDLGANIQGVIKRAIYPAAGMVIEEIKASTPKRTGDLKDSLVLTKFNNDSGFIYTKVEFEGYDRNGVPNPLKARAIESGTSRMRKKPFVRPAVNRIKAAALIEMERNFDAIIKEMMSK